MSDTPNYVYGYCPVCGSPGQIRERRVNGNDTCERGHTYPSLDAKQLPNPQPKDHPHE